MSLIISVVQRIAEHVCKRYIYLDLFVAQKYISRSDRKKWNSYIHNALSFNVCVTSASPTLMSFAERE
jgi:hypothetical protein